MLPETIVAAIKALKAAGLIDIEDARKAWAESRSVEVEEVNNAIQH